MHRQTNHLPKKNSKSRRAFLQSLGAGAASLPFVGMLSDSVAQESGESLPLKFIGAYHPHGVAAEHWVMRDTDTESEFDLSFEHSSLSPFDDPDTYGKSFKDKILLVEGIDLNSSAGGHDSCGAILTGSTVSGTTVANASLDQFLAIEQGLGADTRMASVALAVGSDQTTSGTTLSYGPGGAPLPKVIDPVQAFDLFFAGFVMGDDPEAEARAARQRALGMSVIDFVRADINRLHPKLAQREQLKLDQHLTSLRELEKQFSDTSIGANCQLPTAPDPSTFPSIRQFNGGEQYFPAITDAFIDILAQAMACDMTRFATLWLNDLSFSGNAYGLSHDNHGGVAHLYMASPVGHNGAPVQGNPGTWTALSTLNRYSYSQIARLMQKLDEYGILDSTLIYATSDMGNPSLHSTRNVPTLLAGGANGKFRMGRRLRMVNDCPELTYCAPGDGVFQGTPHNRILVSIAQAFDVNIDAFGSQPDGSDAGTLDGLV